MKQVGETYRRESQSRKWLYSYAMFFCDYCKETVERLAASGKKQRSCGCMSKAFPTKHGQFADGISSPLASVWHGMKDRCFNPNNKRFNRYGGRGISIFSTWLNDPETFFAWALENKWEPGLQIDRINNDLGYLPENCRFVTSATNGRNRSSTKLDIHIARKMRVEFAGGGLSKWDLARKYGVGWGTVADVIKNKTWIDREGL